MTDFVLDASAMLEVVGTDATQLRRAAMTGRGSAPELIDLEVISTLRRLVRSGQMTANDAQATLADARRTPITRTAHRPLLDRVWELRDSVAAYDAAYSMEESVEDAIHQRPLAAVGLALGLGILIGAAWRR